MPDLPFVEDLLGHLRRYKDNDPQTNDMHVNLLRQIIMRQPANILVFFELSNVLNICNLLSELLVNEQAGKRHGEITKFLQNILLLLLKFAERDMCMFVELLLRKHRSNAANDAFLFCTHASVVGQIKKLAAPVMAMQDVSEGDFIRLLDEDFEALQDMAIDLLDQTVGAEDTFEEEEERLPEGTLDFCLAHSQPKKSQAQASPPKKRARADLENVLEAVMEGNLGDLTATQ